MDIERICFIALILSLPLQTVTADTTTPPDGRISIDPAIAPTGPTETPIEAKAEVRNKSKVAIRIIQPGVVPQTLEPTQFYQSSSYPDTPISIQVPESPGTRYITVTGKKGACTVPVCIYVQ